MSDGKLHLELSSDFPLNDENRSVRSTNSPDTQDAQDKIRQSTGTVREGHDADCYHPDGKLLLRSAVNGNHFTRTS